MVCVTCGAEQFFDGAVPGNLKCSKCQSSVFREFSTPVSPDEAALAQLEEQTRNVAYGDSSPASTRDDVRELDA